MPALRRIILINTHMQGVVELNVDGHTNICGTNASGKTTLQRLIPVFYGEYPSRVVPATRDSFEKWYLPKLNSYIIYEYARGEEHQNVCQVVLTSQGKGVDYRLVNKPFEINDYIRNDLSDDKHAQIPTEVVKVFKRDGVLCSRKLNTKEFKAIIQNDPSILASHRDLPGFARVFSLCEPNKNLRHIEKLAKAVHSKEGKMETIKAMVAAILEEDGITPGENKLSPQKVDEWIKECKLIKGFESIRPQFTKLEQAHSEYQHKSIRLGELKQQFSSDQTLLASQKVETEELIKQLKIDLDLLDRDWFEQRDSLNQALSAAKMDVENYESSLDKIEAEFDKWQDKDIETFKDNLDILPRWVNELSSAEARLQLLTEKHQDVDSQYNKQLLTIKEQHENEIAQYQAQRDELKEQQLHNQAEQHQKLTDLAEQFNSQLRSVEQDYQSQLTQLESALATANALTNNIGFSEQEQQQLDLLDETIKEATDKEDQAREALRQAQDLVQEIKQSRAQANLDLQSARTEVAEKQQVVDQLNQQLFPGKGSLLEFLRVEMPGWQESIGKVINPELLAANDLKPSLIENENTLYGVQLELDKVAPSAACANEAEISKHLEQAEQQLADSVNVQTEIEKRLADLTTDLRNAELQLATQQTQVNNAQANRKRIASDKEEKLLELREALRARRQHLQKQVVHQQSLKDKLINKHEDMLYALRDQQREAEMELKTHWQTVINDTQQQISAADSRISQCQSALKTALKQLEAWLQDELNNRGVDVDDIGDLKKQIKKLKADITETEKFRPLVLEYNVWYQTNYIDQKVRWQQALATARQQETSTKSELEKSLSQYREKAQTLKQSLTTNEADLKLVNEQIQQAQVIVQQLNKLKLPKETNMVESGSISQRLSETRELMADREQASNQIRRYVDMFDQKIAAQSGTGFYDTWERSRAQHSFVDEDGQRQLDHIGLVPELDQMINGLIPQKLHSIREQGRIFGLALNEYYKILQDIEKQIALQSARISKEVDEELFLDGVSDSAVKISSKINELEFWPDLQRFNDLYQRWIKAGAHDLPSEEYAFSMRRVIEILGKAALTGGISKLLDIELHINEGGKDLIIRTDRQLNESSSHGMAYLILCKFLLAFTRLLRGDSSTIIHWPIDELGTLHQSNIKKIFDACQNNQIYVVGAFPNPESEVLSLFKNRYLIDKHKRQLQIVEPRRNPISEKLRAKAAAKEVVQEEIA